MHFKDFLQNTAKEIDKELEVFLNGWNKDIEKVSPRLLPLTDSLSEACQGGKRIRGTLVKLGYEMGGISRHLPSGDNSEILKIAAAYEVFQAAILAHDDIIDRSRLRRGKPSLYTRFGGDHIGESLALCLGDIGFFLAFKLIAESGFSEGDKNTALKIFSRAMLETGIGELLDVELSNVKMNGEIQRSVSNGKECEISDDIITVYGLKTAYYTISAPLLLGAVLGGASESSLDAIRIFGQNLGIAFQIQDDVNDIFSSKKRLGKEVGGDIREGKQTLLYAFARGHANKQQGETLKKYYGKLRIGVEEIEAVKGVMVETGALDYAREEAERYSQMAKEFVPKITKNEKMRKMFWEMKEYFVQD